MLTFSDARADDVTLHTHAAQVARAHAREEAARAAELAEQQVEAAAAIRRLENQTGTDTMQLAALEADKASAGARLAAAQAALEKLLPVMQRLSAEPEASLLAVPLSPTDAVRGITIMQGIAAGIEAQAAQVKSESAQMLQLLAASQSAKARLDEAVATQQRAEDNLSAQIADAKAAEMADADLAAREQEAALAAQRKLNNLSDAVANLVAPGAANLPPGSGGAPVAGHIVQRFGASTLAGPAEGVSYGAAPGARVVTPCAGTVMFAGPLSSYGLMVIADCGGGSSVILAGMDHLDVSTGQRLAHGQPVGTMLRYDPDNPTRQPVLYVELRQNGNPVDPIRWLSGGGSG